MSTNVQRTIKAARKTPTHKFIGAGLNAYVGTNDNDNFGPVHRISSKDDGGAIYLQAVANLKLNNPFLPKVERIEQGSSDLVQVAITERLIPFDTPAILDNDKLMTMLFQRYFIPYGTQYDVMNYCYDYIDIAINENNYEAIKDKS